MTPGSESISNRIGRGLVGHLGVNRWLREAGTTLCNLAPVDNFGGGVDVALLGVDQVKIGRGPARDVAPRRPLCQLVYAHECALCGARAWAEESSEAGRLVPLRGLRSVIRNKLVFLARLDERRPG